MAPLRRYLRITKYSVLECRIYLDNPALVHSWLLHPRDPVLPRVLESVRPLVLPKLVEERERARKKGAKNKGAIKDVLVEADFEVSLFLTETDTRHSLLFKHRRARDKTQTRLVSNSSKLTGASRDAPIDVEKGGGSHVIELQDDNDDKDGDDDTNTNAVPLNLRNEDDDGDAPGELYSIPTLRKVAEKKGQEEGRSRRQREKQAAIQVEDSDPDHEEEDEGGEEDEEDKEDSDSLFVSEHSGSDHDSEHDSEHDGNDKDTTKKRRPAKRRRDQATAEEAGEAEAAGEAGEEERAKKKKKLAMDVVYEGFAIYGRVLCLVVKKRTPQTTMAAASAASAASAQSSSRSALSASSVQAAARPAGQAAMENWIASTQVIPGAMDAEGP